MGYLAFGLAVAGALLLVMPLVLRELFGNSVPRPAPDIDADVPTRLEQIGTLLALRDSLADNAPAVEAIDKVLIPAVIARVNT